MYQETKKNRQTKIFGITNILSPKLADALMETEEQEFFELFVDQIEEDIFSCLYSEKYSRPNASIKSLVGAIVYMAKKDMTFDEFFKNLKFNPLVKIALGMQEMDEMPFSVATLFNFRNRLSEYVGKTRVDLISKVFDGFTQAQMKELKIKADIQRVDSVKIASNIRKYSRLQLLVEVIIRMYRKISEEDKKELQALLISYTENTSEHYLYKMKLEKLPSELLKIGKVYKKLIAKLKSKYASTKEYKILERIYREHFGTVKKGIRVKKSTELESGYLQTPDDIEVTRGFKDNKVTIGYEVIIVETCNPDNEINLITDVSTHPINVNEGKSFNERLDEIKEKTPELNEIHQDGGFGDEWNDKKCDEYSILVVQTAIKGREFSGVEVKIEETNGTKDAEEYEVSCPQQKV